MQIKTALQLSNKLEPISDSARMDLELLLAHVLNKPLSYLYTWPEKTLLAEQITALEALLARRLQGEPVAYLIKRCGFWSLDLEVSPHTLIPRPDTEVLVEKALELCPEPHARVADLGTGTGAIALALAIEQPSWDIIASDFISQAVALAGRNCQRLGLTNIQLLQGSWLQPHTGQYDLIVSNPPYIDPEDQHLSQGDVRFEPTTALVAGNRGMADIEQIGEQARSYLKRGAWLLFEHGYDQGQSARNLLQQLGYTAVASGRDYGHNERITWGCWHPEP